MKQLFRFALVGGGAFVVDASIVQLLVIGMGLNPYLARVFSFLAAASLTWALNRRYTFETKAQPSPKEWSLYLGLMIFGGAINYATYALCIAFIDVVATQPWLGVAAGSIAGLGVNFLTSRWFFTRAPQTQTN